MPRARSELKSAFDLNVPRVRPQLAGGAATREEEELTPTPRPDANQLSLLRPENASPRRPLHPTRPGPIWRPSTPSGEWPLNPALSSNLKTAAAEEAKLASQLQQARSALIRTSAEVKTMLRKVESAQQQLSAKQAKLQQLVTQIEQLEQGRLAAASAKEALEALGKHFGRRRS